MISKTTRPCTAVVAALLYATTASAQENHGTPEQGAACTSDAFRLCSSYILDHEGRNLLEAEQIRSQQCVSIAFRTRHRPGGQ